MAAGYRSVLRLDETENAVRVANEQFRSWLVEMVRDPRKTIESADWDGSGVFRLGPDSALTVVEHAGEDQLTRLLLEYVETNTDGTWTTRLYASSAPGSRRHAQMLWFESEGARHDGSPVQPGTPRVVRKTLQTVEAWDAAVPVLCEPSVVRLEDVEQLARFIEDPYRAISIVVAATVPGVPVDRWAKAVATLTRDATGCASFFVLEPDAEDALNAHLGATHSIPRGSVRTFVPRVEVGDWVDARRHRILTAKAMGQGLWTGADGEPRFSERLIRTIAITPRLSRLEAQLPAELIRTMRVLQRERIRPDVKTSSGLRIASQIASATDIDPPEVSPIWLHRLQSLVNRVVGRKAVDEAAIQAIADRFEQQESALLVAVKNAEQLQNEREDLEDQGSDLRRQLEAEQFERALAEAERRDAEKRLRSLERWRATRPDKYTYLEDPTPRWESDPVSVSEIIERLTDPDFEDIIKYVELTDIDRAIDRADVIDAADPNGTYASAFWEYVLVLRDYMVECIAYSFSGNVHMYLKSADTHGRKCPTQRHKANESDTVQNNPRMRRERTFPVPTEVDPSGELFMTAHFAPTHRDQNAPRMYYFADVAKTKKAYIGYIGLHLTNTKTN